MDKASAGGGAGSNYSTVPFKFLGLPSFDNFFICLHPQFLVDIEIKGLSISPSKLFGPSPIAVQKLLGQPKSLERSPAVGEFYGTRIEIWAGFGPVRQLLRPVFSNFHGQFS